ncbi:MAG: LON peptidase substrate-binding domain-containing protein, partial [Candidatus Rokuibacteriota bacterium]
MAVQPGPGSGDFAIPDALPVLPLRDAVVFPLTAVPLAVGQPRSVRLVDDVMRGNRLLALVAQRDANVEPATPADLHGVGTVGVIHQLARSPDGSVRLMVQGIERIRLLDWIGTEPYLVARIEAARDQTAQTTEVDALRRAVMDIFRRLVAVSAELPDELAAATENVTDPRHLVYFVASVVPLDVAAGQGLLEMDPVPAKLRRLVDLLQREVAVRELGRKITTDTEERLSK